MLRGSIKSPNKTTKKSTTKHTKPQRTLKTTKKSISTKAKGLKSLSKTKSTTSSPSSFKTFSTSTSSFHTYTEGPILTSLQDGILQVKFNNPKMLNAMNIQMGERMLDIVSALKKDSGKHVQAVILTGIGRGFSAGGDLEFLKSRSIDTPENNISEMLSFYSRFMAIRQIPVPVIAAINGPAIGAGAAVSCLADVRIMASNATLGWTFSNLGLHPGMGSTFYLPKLTTPSIASHLLLSGDIIDAGLAKQWNLIHDVVQIDQPDDIETTNKIVMDAAIKLAQHYTRHHTLATYTLLKTLRAQQDVGLDSALLREAEAQALTYNSPDFQSRLDKMINRKKKD